MIPDQAPPRAGWRRLIGMGIFSAVMFCLLIALGVWQVHRWHYKDRIQREVVAAELLPPVALPRKPTSYEKVAITGRWLADRAAFYGDQIRNSPAGALQGSQLIMPFQRDNGDIVMVDLGWVRGTLPQPVPVPAGPALVSGYIQAAQNFGPFAPKSDDAHKIFYTLDAQKIGAALGLHRVAPYTLIMLGPQPIAGGPIPAASLPQPPNNSQQYALTWFGLALVVVFEFFFYARKRLKDPA
ncbi:MAG: SURF1 family protein [Acidiphilium sp.]|nr:SURF1 family protein [Acidiphilium sp.]MDD4936256.1 SURF1 family protein [Acidiphilium sp.]